MATDTEPKAETRKTLKLGLAIAAVSAGLLVVVALLRNPEATSQASFTKPQGGGEAVDPAFIDPSTGKPRPGVTPEDIARFRESVRKQKKMELQGGESAKPGKLPNPFGLTPEQAESKRKVVLDPNGLVMERIFAWKSLQMAKQLTPEVNAVVYDMIRNSPDEETRVVLCENFRGERTEEIRGELIARLQNDPAQRVRERAALTLISIADDPIVLAALKKAVQTDPAASVRDIANSGVSR